MPGRHVVREAGDPLQAVHPHLPADRGGQRDDPGRSGGPGSAGSTTAGSPSRRRRAAGRWPRPAPRSASRVPAAPAAPGHRRSPRTAAGRADWRLRCGAGGGHRGHLTVGAQSARSHRVGHRDEHLARSRRRPPGCARCGCCRPAAGRRPATARVRCAPRRSPLSSWTMSSPIGSPLPKRVLNGSPSLAVDVHQVLAHLRVQGPLVEEGDLVEPAALPGDRVPHDGAAALPGAQPAVGLPLELDRVGAAVALDGGRGRRCRTPRRTDAPISSL